MRTKAMTLINILDLIYIIGGGLQPTRCWSAELIFFPTKSQRERREKEWE